MSTARLRSGSGGAYALDPSRCTRPIIMAQLEASAQAPLDRLGALAYQLTRLHPSARRQAISQSAVIGMIPSH